MKPPRRVWLSVLSMRAYTWNVTGNLIRYDLHRPKKPKPRKGARRKK